MNERAVTTPPGSLLTADLDRAVRAGAGLTHVVSRNGSYVALCGYRGTRHGAPDDPMGQPWCVVCVDLAPDKHLTRRS